MKPAAVAVLLSRFPLVTETFILREVVEMERQGQPVVLVPLLRERPAVVHPAAARWVDRALYTPFISRAIVLANARALLRRPARYLALLLRLVAGTARHPKALAGTAGIFLKAVHLAERLRELGVRHVHAHFATHPTSAALIIRELAGIDYSFTAHAHDLFLPHSRALLPAKLRGARFVRVISRYNLEFILRAYPTLDRETTGKIIVVHCGIDPAAYRPAVASAQATAPGAVTAPARLLCVAALKEYKGIPVLIDACARLRDAGMRFECDIVGEGPLRREIERRIAGHQLSGQVRLLGALPEPEVARRLAESTIVVLPGVATREGWMDGIPVALMEALAAGKPVVASAISGIPELVEDGVEGLLVPPEDAPALAAALASLIADPARARTLGARGPAKIESGFRLDRAVADLLRLIDEHGATSTREPALERVLGELRMSPLAGRAVEVRAVHERKDSMIAELVLSGGGDRREVVLKVHRTFAGQSRAAEVRARHEHDVLHALADAFERDAHDGGDGRRLGVPRPLAIDPARAALLLPRCPGRPLDALVREARGPRGRTARTALLGAVRDTGLWLRRMQEHRPAAHHGDFWPGNVFVAPGSVEVIDFEGFGEGMPYADAAYFMVHLSLYYSYPGLSRELRAVRAAFLDGLLGGAGLDAALLARQEGAAAAQVLAKQRDARGVMAHWRRRALRRMIAAGPGVSA